jgi:PAS domain S-box-containing protein
MNTSSFSSPDPPQHQTNPGEARSQAPSPDRRTRNPWLGLLLWLKSNTFAPQWLPTPLRHPLIGYLVAALLEFGALGLILLLLHFFPTFAFHGILTVVGVVLIALSWGNGPSLFATLVGTFLLYYAVLPPQFSWSIANPADTLGLVLYLSVGTCISVLASQSEGARRQAEHAEARSRFESQRLRTVLEVLPSAVLIADSQGQLLEMNQGAKTLWGGDMPLAGGITQHAPYQAWWAKTGQPLAPEDWTLARALVSGQALFNDELEIEALDGRHKIILNSAAPILDEQGTMTGGVVCAQDISEVRRLEREVAERAQELEAIFETMADALFVYDAQGHIQRANAFGRELLGLEAEVWQAHTVEEHTARLQFTDENEQEVPFERLPAQRVLRGEHLTGDQAVDMRLTTTEGRTWVFNMSGTPLRAAEGAITGAILVARDVTERRRLEHELTERATLQETILESITDGIAVIDTQGSVVQTNRALRDMFGLDQRPGYLTRPLEERVAGYAVRDAQGQPLAVEEWPALLQGEVLTGVDRHLTNLEGRELVVNVGGAPIRDVLGHITGCVEVFRDVTERHQLEQRTRDALNALVAMAETIVQAQTTTDSLGPADNESPALLPAGTLRVVAKRLAELTCSVLGCRHVSMAALDPHTGLLHPITVVGLSPEQERAWWDSWSSNPTLEERFGPRVAAALNAGEAVLLQSRQVPERYRPTFFQSRTDRLLPMCIGEELVGVLFVDYSEHEHDTASPEELTLTATIARLAALVLERDRLLRRWAEARASVLALRETQAQMDTFLGIASHELKSPLTTLKLGLQLTERRLHTFARHYIQSGKEEARPLELFQEQFGRTMQQVERMEQLINDLLDVSRIQAGKLDLHQEQTDLVCLVREAIEAQRQAAPERTIIFHHPEDGSVPVLADPGRIEQVVTNYLTNALKYSSAECPVEVGVQIEPQQVRVWVRDEGPGLPPEEQERIWERFYRVKGIELQSGTGVGLGLGLHICRTIVERHQGQVGVESTPGEGSTFWFTLPLTSPSEE